MSPHFERNHVFSLRREPGAILVPNPGETAQAMNSDIQQESSFQTPGKLLLLCNGYKIIIHLYAIY